MSESFEFNKVEHFAAGAIGKPGDRTFYLQLGDTNGHISVKLEKQQVNALAQFLRTILEDLPSVYDDYDPVALREPAIPEWVVGQIAVGVDDGDGDIVLLIEELVVEDEDEDEDEELVEPDGARLRAHISVLQASQFVRKAERLMKASRPPCRLCGQPLDGITHVCPRLN